MPHSASFSVLFTMALGWIALAGLADNLVIWKGWFEHGFMEHWRYLKSILGISIFGLIDRETPKFYFEYILIGVTILRAFQQVDKGRNLNGALFHTALSIVGLCILSVIIGTYVGVFLDREWLVEYFYTIPALHLHRGVFYGSLIAFVGATLAHFYATFVLKMSVKDIQKWDSDGEHNEHTFLSAYAAYFPEVLLWLVVTLLLSLMTVFVASDVIEKLG